jgi:hypothetical protein
MNETLHMSKETEQKLITELMKEFKGNYEKCDNIGAVIDLLCELKSRRDIKQIYCPKCVDTSPQDYQYFDEIPHSLLIA